MIDLIPNKKGIFIRDGTNTYCVRPPCFSLRNYRNLKERSLIVGFVGARGSGKSVGAARTVILDFMLAGKTVWSNMEIGFNLQRNGQKAPIVSRPLDKLGLVELDKVYSDGLIYVDEVNLLAEARRAMSQENLMFSYVLQQLRHRRLNIIWSAQSELHCDDRLRFQTDIFIMCEDVSIKKQNCGIGELSLWKAHDFSGVIKGKTPRNSDDALFYQGVQWNKPWWNTYSTWKMQELGAGTKEPKEDPLSIEAHRIASEIAEYMREESPIESKRAIWKRWKVTDRNMMMRVGQMLSAEYGIIPKGRSSGQYIVEDYLEEGGNNAED